MEHPTPHPFRRPPSDQHRRPHARDDRRHSAPSAPRLTPGLILDGLPPARARELLVRTNEAELPAGEGRARVLLRLLTAPELAALAQRVGVPHAPAYDDPEGGALDLYRRLSSLC